MPASEFNDDFKYLENVPGLNLDDLDKKVPSAFEGDILDNPPVSDQEYEDSIREALLHVAQTNGVGISSRTQTVAAPKDIVKSLNPQIQAALEKEAAKFSLVKKEGFWYTKHDNFYVYIKVSEDDIKDKIRMILEKKPEKRKDYRDYDSRAREKMLWKIFMYLKHKILPDLQKKYRKNGKSEDIRVNMNFLIENT